MTISEPRILLVDDQAIVRDSVGAILQRHGFRVLKAADGVEALALLQQEPVDLILSDVAMPDMNGYQLLERVRANPRWLTIPFLMLTARTLDSDVRFGKELGVDDYLTKPVSAPDLLAAIRGKLRRAEQLAQLTQLADQAWRGTPTAAESAAATSVSRKIVGAPELAGARDRASATKTAGAREMGHAIDAAGAERPDEPARWAAPGNGSSLRLGGLRLAPGQHRTWLHDKPLHLSPKEFLLLEHMARHARHVLSVQDLVRVTHDLETDAVEAGSLVRPLIRSLRRKLGYDSGDMGCIENIRGVGYRLNAP